MCKGICFNLENTLGISGKLDQYPKHLDRQFRLVSFIRKGRAMKKYN